MMQKSNHAILLPLFFLLMSAAVCAAEPAGLAALKNIDTPDRAWKVFRESQDGVLRRAAFRFLIDGKQTFSEAVLAGMNDPDPLVRNRALYECFAKNGDKAYPQMIKMVKDPDEQVMSTLFRCAENLSDKTKSASLMDRIAKEAVVASVKSQANKVSTFHFHRENQRLKDNPTHDYEIVTLRSIQLPLEGWRFETDPGGNGHTKGFFKPDFNDRNWKKLKIGAWEQQGFPGYDGIAWYRITFQGPPRINHNAVELLFLGVDESAWIWLNGKYIGQHDIGMDGWDKPFGLDVTGEFNWDGPNQLTVRVEDTAHAGGIWKPVSVEILK